MVTRTMLKPLVNEVEVISIIAMLSVSSHNSAILGVKSITSVTGVGIGGEAATILLLILLSSKEIIYVSNHWNNEISNSFDSVTIPLLIVFAAIVFSKLLELI